jgi:hypothetical protein
MVGRRFCLHSLTTEIPLKTIRQSRFKMSVVKLECKRMTKASSKKTSPNSASRLTLTTIEEQGILESFYKLRQMERRIIQQLLGKAVRSRSA